MKTKDTLAALNTKLHVKRPSTCIAKHDTSRLAFARLRVLKHKCWGVDDELWSIWMLKLDGIMRNREANPEEVLALAWDHLKAIDGRQVLVLDNRGMTQILVKALRTKHHIALVFEGEHGDARHENRP